MDPKISYKDRIFVAGARGMVGSAICRNLIKRGYNNSPIFALKASEKIDAGKIISKEEISLSGNLDQIFLL